MVKYSFSEDSEISLEEVVQKQGRLIDRLTYELSEQRYTIRYLADKLDFFINRLPYNQDRRIPGHILRSHQLTKEKPYRPTQNQVDDSLHLEDPHTNSSSRSSQQFLNEHTKIKRHGTKISFNDDSESDDVQLISQEISKNQNSKLDREPKDEQFGKKVGFQSEEAKEQSEHEPDQPTVTLPSQLMHDVHAEGHSQSIRPVSKIIVTLPKEEENSYAIGSCCQKMALQTDIVKDAHEEDQKISENLDESSDCHANLNLEYKSVSSESNNYSETQILNQTPDTD